MSHAISSFLDAVSLGRPLRSVTLAGKLPVGGGREASARLVLTGQALVVAAAEGRNVGTMIDLLSEVRVQVIPGRVWDVLQVDDHELRIPAGKSKAVCEILALGRLRNALPEGRPYRVLAGRYVDETSEVERWALATLLETDELLLCWLPTQTTLALDSELLPEATGNAKLLVTDRQLVLVAISDVGDLRVEQLEPGALELEEAGRQRRATLGRNEWLVSKTTAQRLEELKAALEKGEGSRGLEVAHAAWTHGGPGTPDGALQLLEALAERGNSEAAVAGALLNAEQEHHTSALASLLEHLPALTSTRPAEIWSDWAFSVEAGTTLLAGLRSLRSDDGQTAGEPWALELHRALHERLTAAASEADDTETLANHDLELAEHYEQCGERAAAATLLTRRLAALPDEALDDLLPAPDADLTRGAGGQRVHISLQELLVRVRGDGSKPDVIAAAELARLQPLVPERLEFLALHSEGDLSERAANALSCLRAGGLTRDAEAAPPTRIHALPEAMLRSTLNHPLVRQHRDLFGSLQGVLADVETPDLRVLRDYCEQISPTQTAASLALDEAGVALGVTGLQGYVSRGQKSVGTRAYEGQPPFVLVGGRHLDEDEDYQLSTGELRFAIAAEVAHVRFGHTRVTSCEVWAGAVGVGRQSLDLALGVLPLLKGAKLAGRIGSLVGRLESDPVRRVLGGARVLDRTMRRMTGSSNKPPPLDAGGITPPNEALLTANRVMQLTADRAGLLLSGDLRASLRAMFLVRPDLRAELPVVVTRGLVPVLGQRAEDGHITYQDLAVRAAALITFYLSDDYHLLEAALTGQSGTTRLLGAGVPGKAD